MFYKPDECGLDFSGVPPIPLAFSRVARFVPARLVFFFIIVLSFSRFSSFFYLPLVVLLLPPPPTPLLHLLPPALRAPVLLLRLLLADTKLLQDYADPTSLPPFSCAVSARS